MKKSKLIISTGSNFEGGAELQLTKIVRSISKYEIHFLCFAESDKDYGAYSSLKNLDKFHFYPLNIKKPISAIRNFKRLLNIINTNEDKTNILGWLAKGNLIGLFIGFLKPFKTKLFLSHRSRFILNQSFLSQILLYFSLTIYFISPKKIIHIANSKVIYSSKLIRFLLKGTPINIKNCYEYNENKSINKKLPKNKKLLKITIIGRFSNEKGYDLLFKSLSKVDFKYSLTCIGKGCSLNNKRFRNLCHKNSIRAKVYEKINNINKAYIESDFIVSSSYSESFPNVVVESLLNGTPVICTPTGPFLNLLREFNLVSKSFKSDDLTKLMNYAYLLRRNDKEYQTVRKKLKKKIVSEILTPIQAAQIYEKVFEKHN